MKNAAKKILALYFNTWWMPALFFLILLGCFTLPASLDPEPGMATAGLLCAAGAAFLGIICASLYNLIQKRWVKGIINLFLLFACGIATLLAFGLFIIDPLSGPGRDDFARNLEIPADAEVIEPGKEIKAQPGDKKDGLQEAILGALRVPGKSETHISGDIRPLFRLGEKHPDLLRRYLASSPAWRVFGRGGNRFATRRWKIGSQWRYNLHGYYTQNDLPAGTKAGIPDFQLRLTLGLSGKPWAKADKGTTWLNPGDRAQIAVSEENSMLESHCVIEGGSMLVEVFEQSGEPERRLTKTALDFLRAEFEPLAREPSWEKIRRILPAKSIIKGKPRLEIRKAYQPGIYDCKIRVNPGEPGRIYLKAFEATTETPLSVKEIQEKSNEWVGWSNDPEEKFLSTTRFTIYEGEPGEPYAARLEVWFAPDSGGPEKKLLQKIFKIQGWQR